MDRNPDLSADIYLQCFGKGKPKTFLQEVFEEIVAHDADTPQFPVIWISSPDASTIEERTSSRYRGELFFQARYELADRTRWIINRRDIRASPTPTAL